MNRLLVASLIWPEACTQFPDPALLASRGAGGIGAACVAAALPPAPNYAVHALQRQTNDFATSCAPIENGPIFGQQGMIGRFG
jgi:hypothetical protein